MTDEIKPETIKKTQEILGKFIKKPVLTEKLLMKPPFRFLHDICTAVMRETGFFEGVLSPTDCKADSIKDKDGKIAFLQKVIAAVEAANDIKLAVRPNKVVAGHEPTRTNEFLQALGKALDKQEERNDNAAKQKTDSSKKQEKTVESKTKTKTVKRPEKEESSVKKKSSSTKISKTVKTSESKAQDGRTKSNVEKKSPRSEQEISKKSEKKSPKNEEIISDQPEPEEDEKAEKRENNNIEKRSKLKTQSLSNDGLISSTDNKPIKVKENLDQAEEKVGKMEQIQSENKRPISAKPGFRRQSISSTENVAQQETASKEPEQSEPTKTDITVNKTPEAKRPDSSFIRINRQSSSPTSVPPNYITKDSTEDSSSPISRPLTGIRPTTARPASARPAAPRIRDRGEISVQEDVIKPSTGNVHIITDKKDVNDLEEDENVVVVEPENEIIDDEPEKTNQLDSINDQGEHGLLVEQILETQKELDQSRQQIMDNKTTGKTEIEWKSGRNKEAIEKEIKNLRMSIQTLTRSANPLGKLLDFLQEDVDIMQKELANWQEMNATLDVQIAQERSLTDQSIEPLKIHLKELQQSIDEQLDQLTVVKANILRNDQKIYRLLTEMK